MAVTARDIRAAYAKHCTPGATTTVKQLADDSGYLRSEFMAALPDLARQSDVHVEYLGRHPSDVYLTIGG